MDPTTVPPPSREKSLPSPPQNPHTPTDALVVHKGEPSTSRNMEKFKALVVKLAGRLFPAHQSLIERRFDDILPDELLVPGHPPYADMILTAIWELKAEGGSSEEEISDFIEKEYHELPWAHATILNHQLRDLRRKGKITMTHDRCYILCSSINKPEPSPSPSPLSSAYSSSSTSPSSSSSSLSWGGPYQRRKRKMAQVRGRARGRRRQPTMIQVGQRRKGRGRGRGILDIEGRNKVEESELTSMEVGDYSIKDGDLPDVVAKISEEQDLPCKQNYKHDDEGTVLEVDVSDAKVDAPNGHEQSDIVERQTSGEEQDSVMMECEAQVTAASAEEQHGDTFEEQIQPEKQVKMGTAEPNKQLNDDDDVPQGPIHPQEECVEKTEGSPQSCKQYQLKNVEAEQEGQQTEVNQKEIVLAQVQQEAFVEMIEQQNQPCIQQTEISDRDSLQERSNPVRNVENMTSSGGTTVGSRRPGLRSSSKKEDAAPNSKKQLQLVTPLRRSLRSHKTISEASVITEVPDHSKEQVSGRTRYSKRKSGIAEPEQASGTQKTRRTGL